MRTLLISGTDTGIGKTHVTGLLAAILPEADETVQIVKPVETGVPGHGPGDADRAARMAETRVNGPVPATYTLRRFPEPLAPRTAADRAGAPLDFEALLGEMNALPPCDWRLVEGAGGLAVPLAADGRDWTDFAAALPACHVILVIADRLGAINQGRLAAFHARGKGLDISLWLNEPQPECDAVRRSNLEGLAASGFSPVFRVPHGAATSEAPESVRLHYRHLPAHPPPAAGPVS